MTLEGRRLLVTGGCGFIGGALVRRLVAAGARVLALDKLTYAAAPEALAGLSDSPRYAFRRADVCDAGALRAAFAAFLPEAVVHLAAETHVDRSIDAPADFVRTNVLGTATLLDAALAYWQGLPEAGRAAFRFLQVSTDEVFGSLPLAGGAVFRAGDAYDPGSPYAASKAAGDQLARAWHRTYGLPTLVCNGCNTYGPWQFPEKLVPTAILAGLLGRPIPLYGSGANRRDWLHVADHAAALCRILEAGTPGGTYLIAGGGALANLELVRRLCRVLDEMQPAGAPHADLIAFVADRPAHDLRYEVDPAGLRGLGWQPRVSLEEGLRETVAWYRDHAGWWQARLGAAGLVRRGLGPDTNGR